MSSSANEIASFVRYKNRSLKLTQSTLVEQLNYNSYTMNVTKSLTILNHFNLYKNKEQLVRKISHFFKCKNYHDT